MIRFVFILLALLSSFVHAGGDTSISPATYEALTKIQTLLQEQEWSEAKDELDELLEDLKPSFGLALAYQLYGQLHLAQEQNKQAIQRFEQALSLNKLTLPQEAGLASNVAQLYLAEGQRNDAIKTLVPRLDELLKKEAEEQEKAKKPEEKNRKVIKPVAFVALATAYQLDKNYLASISWLELLMKREAEAKENWLQMLMVAYYQTQQYQKTAMVLDDLLRIAPEKEDYWQQQTSMYQLLDRHDRALKSLDLGYRGGYIKKESSLLLLAQLLISQQLPERAGRLLGKHLSDGSIELNERNWRLLAAAWQQGRDRNEAIKAINQASEFMDDGRLLLRASHLAMQDAHYPDVLRQANMAIKKGLSQKDKGKALMLAGNSTFELKDYKQARRYFQQALSIASSAAAARSWLEYLDSVEEYQ